MGSFDALARHASKASGKGGMWSPQWRMEVWKLETVADQIRSGLKTTGIRMISLDDWLRYSPLYNRSEQQAEINQDLCVYLATIFSM